MIRFARVELLMEDIDGYVADYVGKYLEWPRSLINPPARTIDSKSRCQRPKWPDAPMLRPNQLYWPTGATRWGQCIALATTDIKDQILANLADGAAQFEMSVNDATPLTVAIANDVDGPTFDLHESVSVPMYLLPPERVSQYGDTLWIIPLVDFRYWWQQITFVSVATSWSELYDELETALGCTLTRDTEDALSVNYGIPDPCFFRNGSINAAAALDMYCWSTNQRLVAELDGSFVLRSSATANSLYLAERDAQLGDLTTASSAGGEFEASDDGDVPTNIVFRFTNDQDAPIYSYEQDPLDTPVWASGGKLEVMCPAISTRVLLDLDTFGGTTENDAQLEAIADQWSGGYWLWTEARFAWSFNLLLSWHLTGYEDYLLLDLSRYPDAAPDADDGQNVYTARTFIKSLPPMSFGYDFVPVQLSFAVNRSCDMVLFVALEDFGNGIGSAGSGARGVGCWTNYDEKVARCTRLEYSDRVNMRVGTTRWQSNQGYQRVDGWVECVWAPTIGGTLNDVGTCNGDDLKCGTRFWATWNSQTMRYEVVSIGSTGNDGNCPCAWYGYALWQVVDSGGGVPAWSLYENRCTGCYQDEPDHINLQDVSLQDYRYMDIGLNADWVSSPTPSPPVEMMGTDWLYVTCCNVTDPDPPPLCELCCCYSVEMPTPLCDSADPGDPVTLKLRPQQNCGDGQVPCVWSAASQILLSVNGPTVTCGSTPTPTTLVVDLASYIMTLTTITITWRITLTGCGPAGIYYVTAIYALDDTPDCSSALTATLSSAVANFTEITLPAGSEDPVCTLTASDLIGLFEASIDLTVVECDPTTTTTTTTTSTTTPAPTTTSTTTAAPTTTSTTTTTTTPEPTTTTSTTTGSTTTSTTTTGSSTTSSCTGNCNYIGVVDGCGTSPTGFSWSGNGNTCSGCGATLCQADLCTTVPMIIGWPASEGATGSIACPNN